MTRRLQQACTQTFRVELLSQERDKPMQNEAQQLGLKSGRYALLRQVLLLCGERRWVFARTVIPLSTLQGRQRVLGHLGNRSLGAMLFADKSMQRGSLEVTCLTKGARLFDTATRLLKRKPQCIWGRRSVFYVENKPLLVSEFFLPELVECGEDVPRVWRGASPHRAPARRRPRRK